MNLFTFKGSRFKKPKGNLTTHTNLTNAESKNKKAIG